MPPQDAAPGRGVILLLVSRGPVGHAGAPTSRRCPQCQDGDLTPTQRPTCPDRHHDVPEAGPPQTSPDVPARPPTGARRAPPPAPPRPLTEPPPLLDEGVVLPGEVLPLVLRQALGGVLGDIDVLVLQLPEVGLAHLARRVHQLLREACELRGGVLGP